MTAHTTTAAQAAHTNGIRRAWQGLGESIQAMLCADEDSMEFPRGMIEAYSDVLTVLTGRPKDQIIAAGWKRAEREMSAP
jgi:hypothetical protein